MQLESSPKRSRARELIIYLIALSLCAWIMERLFKLRNADLSIPFVYDGGDGIFYSTMIKAVLRNGWYLTNPFLGAPFGSEIHDFPMPDNLHFGVMKLIGLFTANYAVALNLFYLATYPLTTLVTLYVLRRFDISAGPAILAGLLFAFTDYHARRSEHHLMYSAYYIVPIMAMLLLWLCSREIEINEWKDFKKPKIWRALGLGVLVGMAGGAYYTYFALLLTASVGIYLVVRRKNPRGAILPAALFIVIFGTLIANVAPNLLYRLRAEKVDTGQRQPGEAEFYGMKIAQLLLPIDNHRLQAFARIKRRYNLTSPLVNDNADSALGLIAGAGFLVLLGRLLYLRTSAADSRTVSLLDHLSVLNASAVFFGTIGGFGSLIAHLVSPQIRAYNRLSVYICFFSLFAVALLLDRLRLRYFTTGPRPALFAALILLLIFLGTLDQTSKRLLPDFQQTKLKYQNDESFFAKVKASLPPGASIFQVPYKMFPEDISYRHLTGYLHTDDLRWSFGGMRKRRGDQWYQTISALPPENMIDVIYRADFRGVYVDRVLLGDQWSPTEQALARVLNAAPMVSEDQQLSFFSFDRYQPREMSGDRQALKEQAMNPILVSWGPDFSGPEGMQENNWHWCSQKGVMMLENSLPRPREISIKMTAAAYADSNMTLRGSVLNERFRVGPTDVEWSKAFSLPPGKHQIEFECDGPVIRPNGDPRSLVFRINNFQLVEK